MISALFYSNISTILVGLVVIGIVALAVRSIIKDKKSGKGCGGGCSGCAGSGTCHGRIKK